MLYAALKPVMASVPLLVMLMVTLSCARPSPVTGDVMASTARSVMWSEASALADCRYIFHCPAGLVACMPRYRGTPALPFTTKRAVWSEPFTGDISAPLAVIPATDGASPYQQSMLSVK